jgi:hypothetical protein
MGLLLLMDAVYLDPTGTNIKLMSPVVHIFFYPGPKISDGPLSEGVLGAQVKML